MAPDPKWQALMAYHASAAETLHRLVANVLAEPRSQHQLCEAERYRLAALVHEGSLSRMTSLSRRRPAKKGAKKR